MPLPRVYRVAQDAAGNVVPGVLCSVLNQGTGVLAPLWQNDAGTIPLVNPMTSDATYGSFGFYIAPGHYDLTFTKPGYTFQPQLDMQVPADTLTLGTMAFQNADAVAITGGDIRNLSLLGVGGIPSPGFVAGIGGSLYVNDVVGIRTLTPGAALHVGGGAAGTLRVEGGVTLDAGLVVDGTTLTVDAQNNRVGILTTTPAYPLQVVGDAAVSGTMGIMGVPLAGFAAAIGGSVYISSVVGLQITAPGYGLHCNSTAGTPGGAWVNSTSSKMLKRNIRPLDGAATLLRQLQPRLWEWSEDEADLERLMPGTQAGFVVEDVAQVRPAWTPTDTQGQPGLAMRGLEAYLVAVLQDVLTRLEAVEIACAR